VREEKADKSGVMDGKWMLLIRGSLAAWLALVETFWQRNQARIYSTRIIHLSSVTVRALSLSLMFFCETEAFALNHTQPVCVSHVDECWQSLNKRKGMSEEDTK
jgi:hypothetical protein